MALHRLALADYVGGYREYSGRRRGDIPVSIFFTSDLHIGHEKVARIRAEEGMASEVDVDRFVEWGLHDKVLAANWDETVDDDDTVWVLGDISSGSTGGMHAALDWLSARPGYKHLIVGNHDRVHGMYRDSHKWFDICSRVFNSIQMAARRRIPLREGHVDALLSHFPYVGDHKDVDRHTQWRLRDEGLYVLHGHTHSFGRVTSSRYTPGEYEVGTRRLLTVPEQVNNQIHVGVDAWDFKPVALETIRELVIKIEDGEL